MGNSSLTQAAFDPVLRGVELEGADIVWPMQRFIFIERKRLLRVVYIRNRCLSSFISRCLSILGLLIGEFLYNLVSLFWFSFADCEAVTQSRLTFLAFWNDPLIVME